MLISSIIFTITTFILLAIICCVKKDSITNNRYSDKIIFWFTILFVFGINIILILLGMGLDKEYNIYGLGQITATLLSNFTPHIVLKAMMMSYYKNKKYKGEEFKKKANKTLIEIYDGYVWGLIFAILVISIKEKDDYFKFTTIAFILGGFTNIKFFDSEIKLKERITEGTKKFIKNNKKNIASTIIVSIILILGFNFKDRIDSFFMQHICAVLISLVIYFFVSLFLIAKYAKKKK